MICSNCGKEISDGMKFCKYCGADLSEFEVDSSDEGKEHVKASTEGMNHPHSKKKIAAFIVAAVLLLAAAVACVFFYNSYQVNREYEAKIKVADKYLEEENFAEADSAYLEAIEIAPEKSEAYMKICDFYVSQQRYDEAKSILHEAEENTGSSEISDKIEEVTAYGEYNNYINEVVIPEEGLADSGDRVSAGSMDTGLVSALMRDTDGDGMPELVTVSYTDSAMAELKMSLYDYDNESENVVLIDEFTEILCTDEYVSEMEIDVFLKCVEDEYYLIIGCEGLHLGSVYEQTNLYKISEAPVVSDELFTYYYDGFVCTANGDVVAEYDVFADNAGEKMETQRSEEGMRAFEEILNGYNIPVERIQSFGRNDNSWGAFSRMECDESDSTETMMCYIQHGNFEKSGSVDIYKENERYIEDYTEIRD